MERQELGEGVTRTEGGETGRRYERRTKSREEWTGEAERREYVWEELETSYEAE